MESETFYQKFMGWLEKEDAQFYSKYKDRYQDNVDTITLLSEGLTFDEEVALRHKVNLYGVFEKYPPKI